MKLCTFSNSKVKKIKKFSSHLSKLKLSEVCCEYCIALPSLIIVKIPYLCSVLNVYVPFFHFYP